MFDHPVYARLDVAGRPLSPPGQPDRKNMRLTQKFVLVLALALAGVASSLPAAELPAWRTVAPEQRETEANIAMLTSRLLGRSQFSHHPLDHDFASRFLDGYLDYLDASHSIFIQPDLDEFANYRKTLAKDTLNRGDTSAAWAVFARYLERLEQRTSFFTNTLETTAFTFTNHEVCVINRDHTPFPRDLSDASKIWNQQLRMDYLQEKLNDRKPAEIVKTLTRRYTRLVQTMRNMTREEVLGAYLNALAHVYDPHSDYMGHEEMDSFSISMKLSLTGIGALLQTEDGYCKIRELVPGGPARRSGQLKPGDRIVAVAQNGKEPVDMVDMPLSHAVELIRGPKGTKVRLTIIPASSTDDSVRKEIELVRDEIKLADQEAKSRIIELPVDGGKTVRVGVLDIPSFYADFDPDKEGAHRSVTADTAKLLTKLKSEHIAGLILDLRRNGGGSLEEAVDLSGLFLGKGPVVQIRDPANTVEVMAATNSAPLYDGPMVTLTSRFSASASEILAGALQDYGRSVIVGDSSTFGKGTVQSLFSLAPVMEANNIEHSYDPGALKVTIRKFYRPSGASTQRNGVKSDIILPSLSDASEISETSLKDPLPWDTVPAASFTPLNEVATALPILREKSLHRVSANKEFSIIHDELARIEKQLATKSVSLNAEERRQEMEQNKAIEKEQQKQMAARRLAAPKIYDITLENLSTPGLPAPRRFDTNLLVSIENPNAKSTSGTPIPSTSEDDSPADDLILTEAEQILADYTALLGKPANSRLSKVGNN